MARWSSGTHAMLAVAGFAAIGLGCAGELDESDASSTPGGDAAVDADVRSMDAGFPAPDAGSAPDAGPSDAGGSGDDDAGKRRDERKPPPGAIDITEHGADPDGGDIDGVLADVGGCGEVLYFPPGRYRMSSYTLCAGEVWFGKDATLVPKDLSGTFLRLEGDAELDGFELDYSGSTSTHPTIFLDGAGWVLRNVVFRGTDSSRDAALMFPTVPSGGTGRVECVYMHEGNAEPDETQGGKVMWSSSIDGELVLDGLWAEMWAENTLYLSNNTGKITIRNSLFRNTNVGNRVTDEALFENTVVIHDGKQPQQIRDDGVVGGRAQRGLWWNAEKGYFGGDVIVRDSLFYYTHDEGSGHVIDATDGSGGRLTVEDSKFYNTTGTLNIWSEGHEVELRNVCMTGDAEVNLGDDVAHRDIHDDCSVEPYSPIPPPPPAGTTPACAVGRYELP